MQKPITHVKLRHTQQKSKLIYITSRQILIPHFKTICKKDIEICTKIILSLKHPTIGTHHLKVLEQYSPWWVNIGVLWIKTKLL